MENEKREHIRITPIQVHHHKNLTSHMSKPGRLHTGKIEGSEAEYE